MLLLLSHIDAQDSHSIVFWSFSLFRIRVTAALRGLGDGVIEKASGAGDVERLICFGKLQ